MNFIILSSLSSTHYLMRLSSAALILCGACAECVKMSEAKHTSPTRRFCNICEKFTSWKNWSRHMTMVHQYTVRRRSRVTQSVLVDQSRLKLTRKSGVNTRFDVRKDIVRIYTLMSNGVTEPVMAQILCWSVAGV